MAIYQARNSRFRVVVDPDNTHGLYHAIPYHPILYQTKGISALGLDRDLGFLLGHQGHQGINVDYEDLKRMIINFYTDSNS